MSFYSLAFILFLVVSLLAYYAAHAFMPKRQWYVLLLTNLVFYAFNDIKGLLFIGITSLTTWYGAKFSQSIHAASPDRIQRKQLKERILFKRRIVLFLVLFINFGILAYLKYWPTIWNSFVDLAHLKNTMRWSTLLLPMGISFYSFQSMGYMIDTHNDKYKAEPSYGRFLLFISFFPQLVQGPINRFNALAGQLCSSQAFTWEKIQSGILLMLFGLMKKYAIADLLAPAVVKILDKGDATLPGSVILFGVFLYTIQQYADFSGGIDIVLGVAKMFNITMAQNFRQPFFAISLSDFWRRWHITLGAWMRDYVFYPFVLSDSMLRFGKRAKALMGNHFGRVLPVAAGNILVFLLVGIWHGPQLHYILWGLYNGLIITLTDLLNPVIKKIRNFCNISETSKCYHVFLIILTFSIVNIGGYFDRITDIQKAFIYLKNTFILFHSDLFIQSYKNIVYPELQEPAIVIILLATGIVFINSVLQENNLDTISLLNTSPLVIRWPVYYVVIFLFLCSFMVLKGNAGGFMYANF